MIEQLVDGAFSIGDAFLEILKGLGLDFDSFEDILNAIIDFFEGLFGGGDDTTAQQTTNAANNTTSAGSVSGSEGTGDAGIALAATVCVAAAATFVLTRKKKED
jgi:hypothetical protein